MAITFVCECGKTLQVKDEFAGRRVRCPACSAAATAPQPPAPDPGFEVVDEAPPPPIAARARPVVAARAAPIQAKPVVQAKPAVQAVRAELDDDRPRKRRDEEDEEDDDRSGYKMRRRE